MDIESLGWRTELALLAAAGSTVSDHDDMVLVATPQVPNYYWGNFALVKPERLAEPVAEWEDRLATEFARSRHRSIGIDGTPLTDLSDWVDAGYEVEENVVQVRDRGPAVEIPQVDAEVRPLVSDGDWLEQERLSAVGEDPASYSPDFVTGRVALERSLVEAGHGTWWGAFDGHRLLASLGIFRAGDGLARYQSVKTDPEARRRGLARALVLTAAEEALGWGVRHLVIVADPGYHAAGLYRACGFSDKQHYSQLCRVPSDPE